MAEYAKRILKHYFGLAVEHLDYDSHHEIDAAVDDIIKTAVDDAVDKVVTGLGGKIDRRTDAQVLRQKLMAMLRARTDFSGYEDWTDIVVDDLRRTFLDLDPDQAYLDLDGKTERRRYLEISDSPDVASLVDTLNLVEHGKRLVREEAA